MMVGKFPRETPRNINKLSAPSRFPIFYVFFGGLPGITQLTNLPGAFGSVFVARDKRQQERKVLICADVGEYHGDVVIQKKIGQLLFIILQVKFFFGGGYINIYILYNIHAKYVLGG
jgi:hypothetical protein